MNERLLSKLVTLTRRLEEIDRMLAAPDVASDTNRLRDLTKERSDIEPVVTLGRAYEDAQKDLETAEALRDDPEWQAYAEEEIREAKGRMETVEHDLEIALLPKDPNDEKNLFLEIRAGTGGDESALFAGDLLRMYLRYAENRGWKTEIVSENPSDLGGYREVIVRIIGRAAYSALKFESGVHRVQRVPQTETQGRVHTSAASVAVLPEAEEFDVEISMNDIRKDIFCASGPGGQGVNTTYSAIRLTHIPTGIVVTCQDEKSQLKNLAKAMTELRSRIYAIEHQKYLDEIATKRKTMVSTGDRSAKIRTYNYPQGRVTDHRINLTLYNLAAVMDGELGEIIEKLQIEENTEKLKESGF